MLTLAEMETSILLDKASDKASIYTADPVVIRRLKRLPAYTLKREDKQGGRVIAATFEADKKLVLLRAKIPKREYDEATKARFRENLRKVTTRKANSL